MDKIVSIHLIGNHHHFLLDQIDLIWHNIWLSHLVVVVVFEQQVFEVVQHIEFGVLLHILLEVVQHIQFEVVQHIQFEVLQHIQFEVVLHIEFLVRLGLLLEGFR